MTEPTDRDRAAFLDALPDYYKIGRGRMHFDLTPPPRPVHIRAANGMYLCEIRGVVFLTWVTEADRAHALVFEPGQANAWIDQLERVSGLELESVPVP